MNTNNNQEIFSIIKKQQSLWFFISVLMSVSLCLFLGVLINRNNTRTNIVMSWSQVEQAMSREDNETALRIAQTLAEKNPDYYYVHHYLSSVYLALGDYKQAEKHLVRSYELLPLEDTKERLLAVRKVLSKRKKKRGSP